MKKLARLVTGVLLAAGLTACAGKNIDTIQPTKCVSGFSQEEVEQHQYRMAERDNLESAYTFFEYEKGATYYCNITGRRTSDQVNFSIGWGHSEGLTKLIVYHPHPVASAESISETYFFSNADLESFIRQSQKALEKGEEYARVFEYRIVNPIGIYSITNVNLTPSQEELDEVSDDVLRMSGDFFIDLDSADLSEYVRISHEYAELFNNEFRKVIFLPRN